MNQLRFWYGKRQNGLIKPFHQHISTIFNNYMPLMTTNIKIKIQINTHTNWGKYTYPCPAIILQSCNHISPTIPNRWKEKKKKIQTGS